MHLRTLLDRPRGLILFTGPTGVGKTTSMASMLDYINKTRSAHVVTIEDPIEYVLERDKAIFSQKELKLDTPTFAQGLRDALRQKPDVIMVGEIRDRDTADTVFLAAESGHLVLASLHTNSAKGALNKLLSWFPDEGEHRARALADTLLCVVSQTLVPTIDGLDRVLATEVLMAQSEDIRQLIETPEQYGKLVEAMRNGRDHSHLLNQSLVNLVKNGQISERDALRHSNDRIELHGMLNPSSLT
jgi:twitching motility protein PilT